MPNSVTKSDQVLIEQFEGVPLYQDPGDEKARREKTYARLRLLWQHRRFLGKVLLYGLVISLIIAFIIPSDYDSTTQLMPPDQSGSSVGAIASLAGGGGASRALAGLSGLLGGKTSGDLFVGVLSSDTVQDDLIAKFDLRKVYGKKEWKDARKKLDSRTDLSVDKKSELIKIVVTDRSPQRAMEMAREYVDELNRLMAQLNTSASHRERVFLEDRLQEVKTDLENSEKQFSQFASNNVALDIPEQSKAMLEASSQLEGQMIAAQTELQGLRQIYTDSNIRVRETQARIDEIQRQLEKMRGSSGPSDNSGGNGGSDALLYPSVRKLPQLGVTYADLLRATKVNGAIFETLTEQYETAKVNEAKDLPVVKVLDQAQVPEEKSFPPRAAFTIIGGLLALGLGIGWIFGSEHWKSVDPQDPAKSFFKTVAADVSHGLPWISRNGSSSTAWHMPDSGPDANTENTQPPYRGPGGNTST
jgi:uncharacterized protein involved in exopolysaccharide biosynthesis